MARWHYASRDVAIGIYATVGGLVPRPRLHLIRFGGRITSLREMSVPPLRARRSVAKSAPNAKWRPKVVPQAANEAKALPETGCQEPPEYGRPMRLGWAKLLKRVFNLDLTHCPHCGGQLRIIAAITQRQAIEKILNHLGLDPQPAPRAPARGRMAI